MSSHARHLSLLGMFALLALICGGAGPSGASALDLPETISNSNSYTYYSVRPDWRRCLAPGCGGIFVKRVNKKTTHCADGSRQSECYVAAVDDTMLALGESEMAELREAIWAGTVLLRGRIEPQRDSGDRSRFVVSEAWLATGDSLETGTYYRVTDNGRRCFTNPCPVYDEARLNSNIQRSLAAVALNISGATDAQIEDAYIAMGDADGVIVAGRHAITIGPAGVNRVLVATQFYRRLVPNPCQPTGCSGQICAAMPVPTTCEWRQAYACYQTATCELQTDGQCGWRETPELHTCLDGN